MTSVEWDSDARDFLRKLPKGISHRIFEKIDKKIRYDVGHYLEPLVGIDAKKIRIGDYRLFVDYDPAKDHLVIRTIRHRRDAYTR